MRFSVRHESRFSYDAPVVLGPTTVRLRPREDGSQRVIEYKLSVDPAPMSRAFILDAEGNACERLWFDATTDRLILTASFQAETLRPNPFEFVLDSSGGTLPVDYRPSDAERLARYRSTEADPAVAELADRVAAGASGHAPQFLLDLSLTLSKEIQQVTREEGDAWPGARTLREGSAACRDVAMLFVEAARAAGFAARFVSGYQEPQADRPVAMHAWAEAFIPEAGWRGYDPAAGVAVADRHIALAAAASPSGATPTEGTYGGPATSRLDVSLSVQTSA